MKLRELLVGQEVRRVEGDVQVEITGLCHDSRRVKEGDLFFSLAHDPGKARVNQKDALTRGARAVVVKGWDGDSDACPTAAVVQCNRPRRLMNKAATRFYNAPSQRVELIGVTGTSGKTTTTYLLASIFEAAGLATAIVGTIGTFVRGRKVYQGLTTPESIDFEDALAQMERQGVGHAVAEISSIGLAEGRVDELNFQACMFTNLGRDHLDYHGTREEYFRAKLRLFTELLPKSRRPDKVAVVRGDDPFGQRVLQALRGRKISFGFDSALDVHPLSFSSDLSGIRATLSALGAKITITSPLVGQINLLNILGASALSVALGIETAAVEEGVRRCPGAPGRLEVVPARAGVTVWVDYAHKPEALEAVLRTLRELASGRVICVFGCGGDRDRSKRPVMGEIAGRIADFPVLTSDNPRSEDPLAIIAEVEAGLRASGLNRTMSPRSQSRRGYLVEPDRRSAIKLALESARPGDMVIIAGKGHEDYQIVGSTVLRFDDREVVGEIAAEITAGQP